MDEIRERARTGGRAEALGLIEQFLADSPKSPLAPKALLLAATLEEDAERAAARWDRVASEYAASPEAREARMALGRYRVARGQYDAAIEGLEVVANDRKAGEPAASEARFWLLIAQIGRGEPPDALRPALREIRATPWNGWAQVALAEALRKAGDTELALELFGRASAVRGEEALRCAALFGAAEARRARGDAERARGLYEEIAASCPGTIEGALAASRIVPLPDSGGAGPPAQDDKPPPGRLAVELATFRTITETQRFVDDFSARRSEKPTVLEATDETGASLFRVLVGAFGDRAAAEDLARGLREAGFTAKVVSL